MRMEPTFVVLFGIPAAIGFIEGLWETSLAKRGRPGLNHWFLYAPLLGWGLMWAIALMVTHGITLGGVLGLLLLPIFAVVFGVAGLLISGVLVWVVRSAVSGKPH